MKELEYKKIGTRIRTFRKEQGLSQEELSEKIDISLTHMSHIETGSTKLSLTVLVSIAEALNVHTDELLYDYPDFSDIANNDLFSLLEKCTPEQHQFLNHLLIYTKNELDIYFR